MGEIVTCDHFKPGGGGNCDMWIILNSNEIQNGQKLKLGWVFKETIGKICDTWVILNSDENKMAEKTN